MNDDKTWIKKCPKCKKDIFYRNKSCYIKSVYLSTTCRSCSNKNIKHNVLNTKHRINGITKSRNCPNCGVELFYKNTRQRHLAEKYKRLCKRCASINRENKLNKNIRVDFDIIDEKIKYYKICKSCNEKIYYNRLSDRNQCKKFGCRKCFKLNRFLRPNFNKNACKYFDELNKKEGWNLRHALNEKEYYIKDLGYFLDAYDPQKNIVVEWYENHHFKRGKLKDDDIKRMEEIKKYLQCRFIGYDYNGKKIIDEYSSR